MAGVMTDAVTGATWPGAKVVHNAQVLIGGKQMGPDEGIEIGLLSEGDANSDGNGSNARTGDAHI